MLLYLLLVGSKERVPGAVKVAHFLLGGRSRVRRSCANYSSRLKRSDASLDIGAVLFLRWLGSPIAFTRSFRVCPSSNNKASVRASVKPVRTRRLAIGAARARSAERLRLYAAGFLEDTGFRVVEAEDAHAALKLLETGTTCDCFSPTFRCPVRSTGGTRRLMLVGPATSWSSPPARWRKFPTHGRFVGNPYREKDLLSRSRRRSIRSSRRRSPPQSIRSKLSLFGIDSANTIPE